MTDNCVRWSPLGVAEINQMEREMCGYLDWELVVDGEMMEVSIRYLLTIPLRI